ncbi:MAG: glycoside hydrolase family 32 protein [Myxococcales bacterium]|nr:MAG: glycoside hydrolase family 32 protein [Myxococcales bacterium]
MYLKMLICAPLLLAACASSPEHKQSEKRSSMTEGGSEASRDSLRPAFHFTPKSHWMNDPNGLVFYKGEYHLFYQYNPNDIVWGPMHWGHAVSQDLVHWKHLPIALYPDALGTIFSGSAVIDWHNTAGFGPEAMVAIFSHDKDKAQQQSLAYSRDQGRNWKKYEGNPVLKTPQGSPDFRDPKVFWYGDEKGHWVMALAVKDRIHFYHSADLKNWIKASEFGLAYGSHGGVWETPDLFELAIEGTSKRKWVLSVGINNGAPAGGSGNQYFIGDFDGKTFKPLYPRDTIVWADYGADFYAAQSWNDLRDGRRIWIGWMNNWNYADKIPSSGWRGAFSLPRVLSLRQSKHKIQLVQKPVSELAVLQKNHRSIRDVSVDEANAFLRELRARGFELSATVKVDDLKNAFSVVIHTGEHETCTVSYSAKKQELSVDRSASGITGFSPDFGVVHTAPLVAENGRIHLRVFFDHTSMEVFANDGKVVFTERLFPKNENVKIRASFSDAPVSIESLDWYDLSAL